MDNPGDPGDTAQERRSADPEEDHPNQDGSGRSETPGSENGNEIEVLEISIIVNLEHRMREKDFPKTWREVKAKYNISEIRDKKNCNKLKEIGQIRKPNEHFKLVEYKGDIALVNQHEYYWVEFKQILHKNSMLIKCAEGIYPIENLYGIRKVILNS